MVGTPNLNKHSDYSPPGPRVQVYYIPSFSYNPLSSINTKPPDSSISPSKPHQRTHSANPCLVSCFRQSNAVLGKQTVLNVYVRTLQSNIIYLSFSLTRTQSTSEPSPSNSVNPSKSMSHGFVFATTFRSVLFNPLPYWCSYPHSLFRLKNCCSEAMDKHQTGGRTVANPTHSQRTRRLAFAHCFAFKGYEFHGCSGPEQIKQNFTCALYCDFSRRAGYLRFPTTPLLPSFSFNPPPSLPFPATPPTSSTGRTLSTTPPPHSPTAPPRAPARRTSHAAGQGRPANRTRQQRRGPARRCGPSRGSC